MARKALIGGLAAAGVVALGVGGVALATGDRESTVDTLALTATQDGGASAADEVSVPAEAAANGSGGDSGVGDGGVADGEAAGGGAGSAAVPAGVTAEQAQAIALEARPGTVDDIELTSEYGTTVWYVDVDAPDGVEWDVYVDARTGEVIEVEIDD